MLPWPMPQGLVAGVDEAGRGPLAGPVVAAARFVTVKKGDTPPSLAPKAIENYVVERATVSARDKQLAAALRLVNDEAAGTPEERAHGLRAIIEGVYTYKYLPLTCSVSHSWKSWADKEKGAPIGQEKRDAV